MLYYSYGTCSDGQKGDVGCCAVEVSLSCALPSVFVNKVFTQVELSGGSFLNNHPDLF